jgi:hypothetical protein
MSIIEREIYRWHYFYTLCYNFTRIQKNDHPVHTPAAVDYSTFKFGDFSSSLAVVLYGEFLFKKNFRFQWME